MQKKSDDLLKHQVKNELAWDTRTWNLGIETKVSNGVVSLSGIVPSYRQLLAAQEAAHRVEGVLDVVNDLTVKIPHKIPDEEIAHNIRRTLEWDVLVPDERIESMVNGGWVTLEGSVNSLRQVEDTLKAIENLPGVIRITNKLTVEAQSADPEGLRKAIEEALERRADREAERLVIDVRDGEVELYGRVHSDSERRAVVGSISHARGIRKINDHLKIDPYF
ncbi:MAG TPA: BON domain-containing protein [Pyrinomonadaceae bacterium]|nr:BON domain-containing protein [Pyrinomonadaceae bacterium]